MTNRRPIAEFDQLDGFARVFVGDDIGRMVEAVRDPDDGLWTDLSDPARPRKLTFTPTWFSVISRGA